MFRSGEFGVEVGFTTSICGSVLQFWGNFLYFFLLFVWLYLGYVLKVSFTFCRFHLYYQGLYFSVNIDIVYEKRIKELIAHKRTIEMFSWEQFFLISFALETTYVLFTFQSPIRVVVSWQVQLICNFSWPQWIWTADMVHHLNDAVVCHLIMEKL